MSHMFEGSNPLMWGLSGSVLKKVMSSKEATVPTTTSNAATTVDASSTTATNNSLNSLGRAALISTSPQGVQGTDPSARFRTKLFGNDAGLGN